MLTFDNGWSLRYDYMGHFSSDGEWIHPFACLATYELIFVTAGTVYLAEEEKQYSLEKNDMIILEPNKTHVGWKKSEKGVGFYWLHLFSDCFSLVGLDKLYHFQDGYEQVNFFKELNHATLTGGSYIAECRLASFLLSLSVEPKQESKLCHDIADWIRVHSGKPLTVSETAQRFGYSADHLSRLFSLHFGMSLKRFIAMRRVALVKNELCTTDKTVKEIADALCFEDENRLLKFFKYHTHTTPTEYRNSVFAGHTNIK